MAFSFRKFFSGIQIVPKVTSTVSEAGDLDFDTTTDRLNLHDGTVSSPIVTEASSGTISNKNLNDTTVFFVDPLDNTKQIRFDAAGTTGTSTTIASSQTANRVLTLPDATDTLVGRNTVDTLTNKSISGLTNTITNIPNASFSNMPANTFKANNTGSPSIPLDITGTQATAMLDNFVGDSGAGGTKGLVPAPAAGDAAASKFLAADGTWAVVPAGGGTVTLAGVQTLSNKSLIDNSTFIIDNGDNTKRLKFEVSNITTGTTRTLSVPDLDDQILTRTSTDQGVNRVKNKDFDDVTNLIVNTTDPTKKVRWDAAGITVGTTRTLTLPDGNTTLVGNDFPQTLTNKAIDFGTATDAKKLIIPKATKTVLDGLTRVEAATYYATDQQRVYIDNGSILLPIGSGGGSGGTNFVTLDTSFQPVNSDNSTAEASIGSWITYADAPGVAPVDMTGGVATSLTLSRTTTVGEVLDGSGSFKIVKTATNAQGQGTSVVANIPAGFRGKPSSISILFKVISGTLVSGDLKFYVYDITNSQVITPSNNDVVSTSTLQMTWDVPSNCAQIRLGFHFASTSTNAVTFSFDDVITSDNQVNLGSAMSDWQPYTPIFTGFGTVTSPEIFYRRVGDSLHVKGNFTTGTSTATEARLSLPPGLTSDSVKIPSITVAGEAHRNNTGLGSQQYVSLIESGVSYITFGFQTAADAPLTKQNGDAIGGTASLFVLNDLVIPIAGWSTGVINSNSNTFRISSVLANGTRVTSLPTVMGEYRSRSKNTATSNTFSDQAPTTPPSGADGFRLHGADYTSAQTAGLISLWDIFIGKNKQYTMQFYANAGRTGLVYTDLRIINATTIAGTTWSYDPTTGVLSVNAGTNDLATNTSRSIGTVDSSGGVADGYFDAIVSESILPVQSQSNRSEVWTANGNGHGSTNTNVRRWTTTLKNIGSAISYVDSATLGASFTINEDGVYTITYSDGSGAAQAIGISVDSVASIAAVPQAQAIAYMNTLGATSSLPTQMSATVNLSKNNTIRANTDGTPASTSEFSYFRITKVSN